MKICIIGSVSLDCEYQKILHCKGRIPNDVFLRWMHIIISWLLRLEINLMEINLMKISILIKISLLNSDGTYVVDPVNRANHIWTFTMVLTVTVPTLRESQRE